MEERICEKMSFKSGVEGRLEAVIGGDSEGGDCDEVICAG